MIKLEFSGNVNLAAEAGRFKMATWNVQGNNEECSHKRLFNADVRVGLG